MRTPTALAVALVITSGMVQANEDETVVVIGQQLEDSSIGPDFSYVGLSSRTATKTDVAIGETPRAISIVTREQMDDRASISIADALQYTPSIQANYFGEDNKQDWFVIRGFEQANSGLYQDGTRLYSSGFYSWQIDPFGLERVEVLRGPGSALYGQTPPGGVINVVSKRPQFDGGSGQFAIEYGTDDRKQISLDVNSEVNDKMAFRLQALGRKNGSRVDGVEAERIFIAPSLAYKFTDDTKITLLTSYQKDDSDPYLQFLPMEGTLTSNPNGKISDSTAVGDTDWETFEREQLSVGYEFEHHFNERTYFMQNTRYSKMDINLRQMYTVGFQLDPTKTSILRGATTEEGTSDAFNVDNRIIHNFETGIVEHTLLAGIDFQNIDIDSKDYPTDGVAHNLGSDPFVAVDGNLLFNIFNPSYGGNVALVNPTNQQPYTESDRETTKTKNNQLGLYLQNQMMIADKWAVQIGVRYDDSQNKTHNTTTGAKTKVDNEEWTTNFGVAYLMDSGFTPYASYAQSFNPIIEIDANGDPAKPERGEQYEIGLKYQPHSFEGYFNIAAFEVSKENLKRIVSSQLTQIGEVRNRGIELEAVANVTDEFTLIGNVSFIDSEITEDVNSSHVGNTPSQIADQLASAWANYRFLSGPFDGLTVGAGARYVGDSYADNTETNKVPSYTLFDATVSYRVEDYKFQIAAKNLADKEYVATCSGSCFYGDRRNVIASVTYDW
ncbi:TonB-dependent siderophore receptor [Vibrio splendidus]|uniref:TonB-dependent siderophore receptor n=1 Tax=Vibrio splendidus TaxID=29497 RepID=UPI000C82FB4A|nr:TonB-dependent siderophore receptor [Vibrio splendidus]MCW4439988.1 TonB-dependent siderophore receptor [Vibrio splendidus]MDH6027284.1 TonB-dependent siderophore receptor [Vibrio splendidus]PMG64033.1 ligand-gated channel protein [Vibrio splendidus]PMK12584.1 ligand-gated channel protein [Vibrio splendidus]PTP83242.1 TonB-dependent siderophore receptor [Vibrio splendidus]